MNPRENVVMEGDEGRNGLKQSQLKAKRRGVTVDRERLYEENQELRGRLRELEEANLRLKTQVAVAEKEKEELFNMAEEEVFHPRPPQRSQSGAHKMSAGPSQGRSNFTLLKEKQNSAFKKLLRDRQNENDKLRIENQNIKKTMKFTRLNELITENNEVIEETRRLRIQLLEARNATDQLAAEYSARIDTLRKDLQQEKDVEKRNGVELKRAQEANAELKEKLRDCELRKVEVEKRLAREIKALKTQNQEMRLKVNTEAVGKECDRPQCAKNRKEKGETKKKIEQQEKEIKHLREQLQAERGKAIEKQLQLRSQAQVNKQNKRPSQPKQNSIVPEKKEEQPAPKEPVTPQKVEVQKVTPTKVEAPSPIKQSIEEKPKSSIVVQEQKRPSEIQSEKAAEVVLQAVQIKPIPAELAPKPAVNEKKPEEKVVSKPKEQQHNDSYDTEKLLESYESSHENGETKPAEEAAKKEVKKAEEQRYKESDGQYEQIDFDEEEQKPIVVKQQPKQKEKEKEKEKKAKGKDKKQKEKEKEKVKPQQKSKKKLDSDEEVLYEGRKDEDEDTKAELKVIRETLTYKFIAQGYSYDQFANYMKESKKKAFGVQDIMSILSEQPFLLNEQHVQAVIIYLFETNNLNGDETLSTKIFTKKMKKFLGKAKPLDEATEKEHIGQLISLIQADERGKKKIRKQCEKNDSGDGTISRQAFLSILKSVGVDEQLSETALSQITYTSTDINHLNYDIFLKRFNEAE